MKEGYWGNGMKTILAHAPVVLHILSFFLTIALSTFSAVVNSAPDVVGWSMVT
jgi:hypothetical protein